MSTASIIAISAFVVLFIILMLAASVAILWSQWHLLKTFRTGREKVYAEIADLTESNLSHRQAMIELLSNLQQTLELLTSELRATLESHRTQMEEKIGRVNGTQLAEAARLSTGAATRIEHAAVAFGQLAKQLLSEQTLGEISDTDLERARRSGLGPESYAPGPPSYSLNRTALSDLDAIAEEAEENTAVPEAER